MLHIPPTVEVDLIFDDATPSLVCAVNLERDPKRIDAILFIDCPSKFVVCAICYNLETLLVFDFISRFWCRQYHSVKVKIPLTVETTFCLIVTMPMRSRHRWIATTQHPPCSLSCTQYRHYCREKNDGVKRYVVIYVGAGRKGRKRRRSLLFAIAEGAKALLSCVEYSSSVRSLTPRCVLPKY